MMQRCVAAVLSALAAASWSGTAVAQDTCGPQAAGVMSCLRAVATSPGSDGAPLPPLGRAPATVRIYLDRSRSMAGYLDTTFGPRFSVDSPSLRRHLTHLLTIAPTATSVYGFGTDVAEVRSVQNQGLLAQLLRRDFYRSPDTQLEDVLDVIAQDTSRRYVHLLVTDGRRGDGGLAISQFSRMGELAQRWVAGPAAGVFAVGAAAVPFAQVGGERSGCQSPERARMIRCPLYVFAFLPRGAAASTLEVLRGASDRLFAAPTSLDRPPELSVDATRAGAARSGLHVFGNGTPGDPLLLALDAVQRTGVTTALVQTDIDLTGSQGRWAVDDSLVIQLTATPLNGARPTRWRAAEDLSREWVQPQRIARGGATASATHLILPVSLRTHQQMQPTAYRVEVYSAGVPGWLGEFNAAQFGDPTKTYGLSALFQFLAPRPALLARFHVGIY